MIIQPYHLPKNHLRRRRGTIYLLALCMSLLISVIGLAGLMASRAQLRTANAANDFAVARLCARAGMEAAMFQMRTDPTWRTDLGNGTWFNNIPLGHGSYTVSAVDPVSGDITIAGNHPVVLTSTGYKGNAAYSLQATIQPAMEYLGAIGTSMCCGGSLQLNNATVTSNQIVACNYSGNGVVNLGGTSFMNAAVESVGTCQGSTYTKSISTLPVALSMPDPVNVFNSYVASGTAISYTSLPLFTQTQLVANGTFETNVSGWYVFSGSNGVQLKQDGSVYQQGIYSLQVHNRHSALDVAATDLPLSGMINGHTYQVQMPIFMNAWTTVQATLLLQNSVGTQFTISTSAVSTVPFSWTNAQGNLVASWTGTLAKATLLLTTPDTNDNYNTDNVQVQDVTYPNNTYLIERQLLSPSVNPFGTTNANGIYVLNCGNQNVVIANSRIVGTLVLTNCSNNGTTIEGSMIWEPALPNYPALLTASNLIIATSSAGLSEAAYGVNFNPSGTPYPYVGGTYNATQTDGYPSTINGIVYCGGNLTISGSSNITGTLITAGSIQIQGSGQSTATLNLTYNNAPFITPPPGFTTGNADLDPLEGTWNRVTH